MYKNINADYYGFRDDDDGVLEKLEAEAEKDLIAAAVDEWKANNPDGIIATQLESEDNDFVYTPQISVPSAEEIEQALLEQRKQEVLREFGISS